MKQTLPCRSVQDVAELFSDRRDKKRCDFEKNMRGHCVRLSCTLFRGDVFGTRELSAVLVSRDASRPGSAGIPRRFEKLQRIRRRFLFLAVIWRSGETPEGLLYAFTDRSLLSLVTSPLVLTFTASDTSAHRTGKQVRSNQPGRFFSS